MKIISKVLRHIRFWNNNLNFESPSDLGVNSLFRFASFDQRGFYKDLMNNILYFPSFSQLNDPFDGKTPIKYELCKGRSLEKYLHNLLANKRLSKNEKRERIEEAKIEIKNDPDSIRKRMEKQIESNVGTLSFSDNNLNLLLWSHYADKHTGFCVEIDAQKFYKILEDEFGVNSELVFIFKVKYQEKFPIINPCKHSSGQRVFQQFLIKSIDWKYENEWRVILLKRGKQKRQLPKNFIKNIYFGLNTSDENIQVSKNILKASNPEAGIFKAIKKLNSFGLEFERI